MHRVILWVHLYAFQQPAGEGLLQPDAATQPLGLKGKLSYQSMILSNFFCLF